MRILYLALGTISADYCTQIFFFTPHPPHASIFPPHSNPYTLQLCSLICNNQRTVVIRDGIIGVIGNGNGVVFDGFICAV